MAEDGKLSDDEKIIKEAKEDFKRCEDWESEFQPRFINDLKFANGDSDNNWQWDDVTRGNRNTAEKPSLTINKTRQHNLQIINDAKQNKPGVNIRPVGGEATYDAAQVFEGIVRHIEYQSNAETVYDRATVFQVQGGIGYWRVVTDYVSDDSFDQEIYLRPIKDMLAVYLDPDINEPDGSDARFGFVFEDVPKKVFEKDYPDHKDDVSGAPLGNAAADGWLSKDHVRVAEYYRRDQKSDKLCSFIVPEGYQEAGQQIIERLSKMTPDQKAIYELVKDDKENTQTRDIVTDEITWYKIAGNKIIDRRNWLGKYVPIVRVIGEETIIEGKMDRKGHTRAMKDPNRMYNYWTSEATAQVAFQTQSPYIGAAEAIEGRETEWSDANVKTAAVLTYNHYTEDGNELPRPSREAPPQMASAYVQGMQICENQMMMASGQYQSQFGQNENATSGKAINERQRQGDNATYHFIDNLAVAIRFTGKILIDLVPKVYDTERVIRILAKDGKESQIKIQPDAPQGYQKTPPPQDGGQDNTKQAVAAIFNPNVGRYEVESDVGPGYATRRQEGFNAMTQIASQNDKFMEIAGDIMWRSADFPMADEIAERWEKTIPPALRGEGPSPEVEQAKQQIQQLQDAIVALQKQLTDKDKEINIKGYDATTKRLTAFGNSGPGVDPNSIQMNVRQVLMEMLTGGGPEQFDGAAEQGQPQQHEAAPQPDMGQPAMPDMAQQGMQ
jgi:hypothetical protein